MNIFTHEQYMQDQQARTRRQRLIGMILIFISLSLAIFGGGNNLLLLLAYPFLVAGFPIWTLSRGSERRLRDAPRADQLLNQQLKSLNNKYSLHHYPMPGGKLIHHLLITPSGLIAMTSSDAVGPITCKNDRWKSQSNWLDRMTGTKPAIGNLTQEAEGAVGAARQLIAGIGKPNVPIKGLVVFTRDLEVYLDSCSYPAVPLTEVKQAVRELELDLGEEREEDPKLDLILTSEDRRRLNAALSPQAVAAPAKPAAARR